MYIYVWRCADGEFDGRTQLYSDLGEVNSNLAPENDVNGDLLSYALNARKGLTVIYTGTRTTNTPVTYGAGYILKRSTDTKVLVYDVTSDKFWQNCNPGGAAWKGWSSYVTNSDLTGIGNSTIIKRTQAGQAWVTASSTIALEGTPGDNEALVLTSLSTKDGKWNIGTQSNTNYLYFRYVAATGSVATYIIDPDTRTTKWL